MGSHLARGQLLLEQSRYDLAEQELRQAVAEEPEPALAHALLALCLVEREKLDAATAEARAAVGAQPDFAFAHYATARVLVARRRIDDAFTAVTEALRLDPDTAPYHALAAEIRMQQRRWVDALASAEAGLRIDAEDASCNNLRAAALVQLGRRSEAGATIDGALERDPENASTHANKGWALLHQNDPRAAMTHFREALRLEPGHEWARAGIIEALKARNPIYGLMLRYFLWMSRLSGAAQWGVVMGGYFGQRALSAAAKANPSLAPFIKPILALYAAFVVMTWTAYPLFNLFLRLHPLGKHALSSEDKRAANWVGLCFFLAIGFLIGWLAFNMPFGEFGAITFGLLLIPLASVFTCHAGWPRWVMAGLTAVLFGLRVVALVLAFTMAAKTKEAASIISTVNTFFYLGAFVTPFLANFLMRVEPER